MPRTILVTGNCQAPTIAAVLQRILSDDVIRVDTTPNLTAQPEQAAAAIAAADVWISSGAYHLLDAATRLRPGTRVELIKAPRIWFAAFHPDITYLFDRARGTSFGAYHSRIAVWAYRRGLSQADTAALFKGEVFHELGYFELWNQEWLRARLSFEECALDFQRFFRRVKRHGCFMNTVNHPRAVVMTELAKALAVRLGAAEAVFETPVEVADTLCDIIWPLYPEIADSYSLSGGYDWVMSKPIPGKLKGFIEQTFSIYDACRMRDMDLVYDGKDEHFTVLRTPIDERFDRLLEAHIP